MMFLTNFNFVFLIILNIFSFLAIRINSLFFTWVLIELNLLIMSPLMLNKRVFIKEQTSLVLKYFLIQVLRSIILLIRMIFFNFYLISLRNLSLMLVIALILKAGIPPLHFWFPQLLKICNPLQAVLMLTTQKIIPLFIIRLLCRELIIMFILISVIIGRVSGFNQNSLLKLIAYSSIVHSSWIISGLMANTISAYFYFILYVITSYIIIYFISFNSIKLISEIIIAYNTPLVIITFIIIIFTLSGSPPFIGFFSKAFIITSLIKLKLLTLNLFLVLGSTVSFYYYLRMTLTFFSFNSLKCKDNNKSNLFSGAFIIIPINLIGLLAIWSIS